MLVHFPNALLFSSVVFDAAGAWLKCEDFRDGALWLLIPNFLGWVGAAMAGDRAEEAAEKAGMAESMIETHEALAFVTLGFMKVLL